MRDVAQKGINALTALLQHTLLGRRVILLVILGHIVLRDEFRSSTRIKKRRGDMNPIIDVQKLVILVAEKPLLDWLDSLRIVSIGNVLRIKGRNLLIRLNLKGFDDLITVVILLIVLYCALSCKDILRRNCAATGNACDLSAKQMPLDTLERRLTFDWGLQIPSE